MAATISEPKVIERGPCNVVGAYAVYEGDDEGPAWGQASAELDRRKADVLNREGDTLLGFLYRPHKDDPDVPQEVRSCFMGVEVTDLGRVPDGMAATRFSGGKYIAVACRGDTEMEAAVGVGDAVRKLERWMAENGCREGDACFCFSHEEADTPPFIQHILAKLEEPA